MADLRPSFFEVMLMVALDVLTARGVEVAVIEAGVGGTNDATSLLPGVMAVITTVGLDHCDRLGDTIQEIARDKAGIAVPGGPLVLGPGFGTEAELAIRSAVESSGLAPEIRKADPDTIEVHRCDLSGSQVTIATGRQRVDLHLPLPGRFQIDNLATVAAAIEALAALGVVRGSVCLKGIATTTWPGRLEHIAGEPEWLLDVAHNAEGLAALAASLDELVPRNRRLVLLGTSKEEASSAALAIPEQLGDEIWLVDGFYRALGVEAVARCIRDRSARIRLRGTVEDVVPELLEASAYRSRVVVVTGSVFLVGAVRQLLGRGRSVAGPAGPETYDAEAVGR
jgi:folylpolyglutamate synthase/dihydrofolate synthase